MGRRSAGEAGEFEAFVAQHGRDLARSAVLITADPQLGQDAVQEALAQAWAHWHKVSTADSPLAYTRRIVWSRAIDLRRRGWRRERPVAAVPDHPDPRESDGGHEDRERLIAALRSLPRRQRAAVILRHWEGLSVTETAEVLRLSPNAVSTATSRGLTQLREQWSDRERTHG